MTSTEKTSSQVTKVRTKIAEYYAADNSAFDKLQSIDCNADVDAAREAQDNYLEACKLRNRIGGEIKKMARKAIELYYGGECAWFKYEYTFLYINKFNETFQHWN